MWTQFMDMHSGGDLKESPYEYIYIEAPKEEARVVFYNRFGHNPERVTCTCCGDDYSISSSPLLEHITAYERGCKFVECERDKKGNWIEGGGGHYTEESAGESWHEYQTLEEYKKNDNVLFIYANDIKAEERMGEVPEQGYVWQD